MRLLALAEIAGAAFERRFVVRTGLPPATLRELHAATDGNIGELPADLPLTEEAAWLAAHELRPTDTLVLDGYCFDFAYQTRVRAAVGALVYLDDLAAFPQAADAVINPAGGVATGSYDLHRAGARLLHGPGWAPLRAPFRAAAAAGNPVPGAVDTVLLCLGGADLPDRTRHLAADLLAVPGIEMLHVVVGGAYGHWAELKAWAAPQAPRLTLHRALSAEALAPLMQTCGAAVVSASTVSYEYASVGGLLTVLLTADNQRGLHDFLLREGLARPAAALPNILSAPDSAHTQALLWAAQKQWFDGEAPARLRQLLRGLAAQAQLQLRPVTGADSALLLAWANEPLVRAASYQTAPITAAEHAHWLPARLADDAHLLLLADVAGQPAGTIRFALDAAAGTATLSFLVAPAYRGLNLAAALLLAGTAAAVRRWPAARWVVGHVQRGNAASLAAFRRAGFTEFSHDATPPDSVSFRVPAAA